MKTLNSNNISESKKKLSKVGIIEKFKLKMGYGGKWDAPGDVDLSNMGYKVLPLPFGRIQGNFDCSLNGLESLENCPESIHGDFIAYSNRLKKITKLPELILGNVDLSYNKITEINISKCEIQGYINLKNNPMRMWFGNEITEGFKF